MDETIDIYEATSFAAVINGYKREKNDCLTQGSVLLNIAIRSTISSCPC